MKIKREAGFTGTEILIVSAIVGLVFTFVPQLNPIAMLQKVGQASVKAPTEEAWKEQEQRTIPRTVGVDASGEKVIAFEQVRTFRSGASRGPAKQSYGERVSYFFANLTTWGVILVVGGFAFLFFVCGITPGMIWRRAKIKAEEALENERADKAKYEKALRQTVEGIRDIKDPTLYDAVTLKLGTAQDKDVKELIDVVKSKLHK